MHGAFKIGIEVGPGNDMPSPVGAVLLGWKFLLGDAFVFAYASNSDVAMPRALTRVVAGRACHQGPIGQANALAQSVEGGPRRRAAQ